MECSGNGEKFILAGAEGERREMTGNEDMAQLNSGRSIQYLEVTAVPILLRPMKCEGTGENVVYGPVIQMVQEQLLIVKGKLK